MTLASLLLSAAAASAAPPALPISDGLPAMVDADIKERDGYDDFPHTSYVPIPVSLSDVVLDGREATSDDAYNLLFTDDHGILLPPGGRILRLSVGTPKEIWEFPIGTRLVHRFYLKTDGRELFELRLIEKRADGQWAFGAYTPAGGGSVALRFGGEPVDLSAIVGGSAHRLQGERVHSESCRGCHVMHALNNYPEDGPGGPCVFGPGNPGLSGGPGGAWARSFESRHGYNPFLN